MPSQNILFFTCFNVRSIHIESSVLYFKDRGYNVFFLTTCESGPIHKELISKNVIVNEISIGNSIGIFRYIKMISFLIKYSKMNQIDFIYSHLQIPNLVSSISRFFIKAKVFTVRHNSDVIELSGNYKEIVIEKIINKLSKYIIAISDKVKDQLIKKENVNPSKIIRINNGYDFKGYEMFSNGKNEAIEIREKYACDLLIVSPGRLIKTKRHDITIKGIDELLLKGFDVKLLILGDGPDFDALNNVISDIKLTDKVFLLGYCENISDYLKAADVVTLLSESEASSNIVKEAAYFEKPVIVCENVGDFSDYIEHEKNGFLVSKTNPLPQFLNIVEHIYLNRNSSKVLGKSLKEAVMNEFSILKVGLKYEELQQKVSE